MAAEEAVIAQTLYMLHNVSIKDLSLHKISLEVLQFTSCLSFFRKRLATMQEDISPPSQYCHRLIHRYISSVIPEAKMFDDQY